MQKPKKNLLIAFPELVEEWVERLNLPLTPNMVTIGSKKTVFWQCKEGHIYQSSIRNRTSGHNCPICANQKIVEGINDLQTINPELAQEWDFSLNSIFPTQVGANSRKKVYWKCEKGHSWQAVIYDRHSKKTKCPYCSGRFVVVGENDFMSNHPELICEWDKTKNKILPNQVHNKSSKKIWWRCKYGHSWNAPVYSRSNGIGCPICAKESQTSFPEQAIFFYVQKFFSHAINRAKIANNEADVFIPEIKTVIEYDGMYWHQHKSDKDELKNKDFQKEGCRVIRIREFGLHALEGCDNIILSDNLYYNSYEILDDAIKTLLLLLGISNAIINTKENYDSILERTLTLQKENSLIVKCPDLIAEWDNEKNGGIRPEHIDAKSRRKVWWICPTCSYSYKKSAYDRSVKKSGCPICSNKRDILHHGTNDLESVHPEIAKEWDYELNYPLQPKDFSIHSSSSVWWKCKKGHSYQKGIHLRLHNGGCPYCRGLKTLKGYNDFASVHPNLLYLWDSKRNEISPSEITSGSNKKVWWICKNGHHFLNSPKRIAAGERCPYCSGRKIESGINSLFDVNPELAKEWDDEKNVIKSDSVAPNSTKKYWWKCRICGHSWQASCANRHSKQSGCPNCYKKSRK